MKRFSSWATGARRRTDEAINTSDKADSEAATLHGVGAAIVESEAGRSEAVSGRDSDKDGDRLLDPWEMVEFGRQCKRLIDAGRLDYLRRELPHLASGASLVTYCSEEVTPENCLLIAAAAPAAPARTAGADM